MEQTIVKEKENKNILKSKDELFKNIKKFIDLNKGNMKLQKKLNEKFMEKGIDNSTIFPLFRGDIEFDQIKDDEIRCICLLEGIEENVSLDFLNTNKIELNVNKYFTEGEILKYKLFKKTKDDILTSLNLKNVRRINKYEYEVYMSAEYLSKMRKSGKPRYYGDFQRPLEIVINSLGEIKKKISIDKKNLKELTNRFMGLDIDGKPLKDEKYDLITTDIYMFSIWEDGKEPFFVWEGEEEPNSIGTLDITPVYDSSSENYCPFIIGDGFHRFTAICNAFDTMESKGQYLDKGFIVHLILSKVPRTQQFISDTFKRTDLKKDVKEATTKNPMNDALDSMIENCYILKGKVANTYENCKILNALTYRSILLKTLKLTKLDFSKKFIISSHMSNIGEIISAIFEKYENLNVNKESKLYSSGIFAGYVALANTMLLVENKVNYNSISKICDMLIEMNNKNMFDDYNVDVKNTKIKDLYVLMENMVMEMFDNAKA